MFEPSDEWHAYLPEGPAEERLVESRFEIWPDISRPDLIGLGWTMMVGDLEDEFLRLTPNVPGFRWSAVGIVDPSVDYALEEQRQQFGVIFYVEDAEAESQQLGVLELAGVALPIVQRPVRYEPHRGRHTVTLPNGRVACWATSAGGQREGWLTAAHVADGCGFPVVEHGRECIDAALVDVGPGGGGHPTRAVAPAAGMTVEIEGNVPQMAYVLDVASTLGSRRSTYFPLRFSMSATGVPGDSGSLIRAEPCSEPAGIYLGGLTVTGSGRQAGVGLAICQLEELMQMEVYL